MEPALFLKSDGYFEVKGFFVSIDGKFFLKAESQDEFGL